MEKIYQHIEKLLAQHDYVVVPNLGGFVAQSHSAVLSSDCISPPFVTIGFNPLLHHPDGLLAIEIARTEGISYRSAMELINKEVEEIKIKLNNTRNVQFGNLGVLQQNEVGNLLFTPVEKADFLPQNFGLSRLHISQKNTHSVDERKRVTFTLPSTRMYKYAAASMLIFGLMFISPKVNDMRQTNQANLLLTLTVKTQKIAPLKKTVAINIDIPKDTVAKVIEDVHKDVIEEKEENFHVIVASSSSIEAAENYCKELTNEKFKHAHVLPPAKNYRVAIQSFSDREIAIEFMENLRETDNRFETAWVYVSN